MPFSLPIRSLPVDEHLSAVELWFSDKGKDVDDNWPSGRFLVRGGICWPDRYDQKTDSVRGCAIVAGYNLATDRAYVFDEQPFACIDHIVNPQTREVLHEGLAPWFAKVYSLMLADTFYVWQPDPERDRWERECRHSVTLQANPPRFVAAPEWGDVGRGESLIWEWFTRRRLFYRPDRDIAAAVKSHRRGEDKFLPSALHALACCLSGTSTQIEGAREAARDPVNAVRVSNALMTDHKRDWRGNT